MTLVRFHIKKQSEVELREHATLFLLTLLVLFVVQVEQV